jgi:hypothetical protein
VVEPKRPKNRLHLDLATDDVERKRTRSEALGRKDNA